MFETRQHIDQSAEEPDLSPATQPDATSGSRRQRRYPNARSRQKGAETLAGALMLLVFMPLLFIIVDVGWGIFVKVTLQHAVREGVRYAITSQTGTDSSGNPMGQLASIKAVVIDHAAGLLNGQEQRIKIEFFEPNNLVNAAGGATPNVGGNVVMVTVENYEYRPLIVFGSPDADVKVTDDPPIYITVHAADRMEACPLGACAPL